jgi:hypothetical protein
MKFSRLVSAGVLLVVLTACASALAHGGDGYVVQNAKHKRGPWVNSPQKVKLAEGKSKNLYVRIKNTSDAKEGVELTETGAVGAPYYHYSWFKGKTDISHDVQTSGYDFSLKPDRKKRFRIKATALDTSDHDCVLGHFDVAGHNATTGGFYINGNGCQA